MIPTDKQDWYSRYCEAFPSFRIDVSNPQQGEGGPEVWSMYGYTASLEKSTISYDHNAKLKVHSEGTIEIVGGQKVSTEQEETILITTATGNITIKADKNGAIKISGKNITIEAENDLELSAGGDIKMRAGNVISQNSNVNTVSAHSGNAIPPELQFLHQVYDFSKIEGIDPEEAAELGNEVGEDVIKNLINFVAPKETKKC